MSTSTSTAATTDPNTDVNIRIYNTLSRQKEPLQPVTPGKVGMYLCGPTVYKEAHIGHMVGPVIFDTIKRYLVYCGYDVTWVVNITDVDDKLIAESNRRGIPMADVATEMTADYLSNLKALGVDQIDEMPKATEHMVQIIEFIGALIEKGYAYESDGDVYFEVSKDEDYGKLSNRSIESQQGEGGEMASRKRNPGDFALWKGSKPEEPSWESPWGSGRPGWHIECSAMSHAILGETFDIHGGGLDLMFPHHENEIAQSESCHNKPMARCWMHNGLMRSGMAGKFGGRADRKATEEATGEATVDTKISRSKGAGGLADLIAAQTGERIRYFLLRTHYRSTMIFNDEALVEAGTALETFYRLFERYQRITNESFFDLPAPTRRIDGQVQADGDELSAAIAVRRAAFLAKMDDDFNSAAAISDLFQLARELNKFADQAGLEDAAEREPSALASFKRGALALKELAAVLGLFTAAPQTSASEEADVITALMRLLIEIREDARANKDFATADRVRDDLAAAQIVLEDRKGETTWRREGNEADAVESMMELLIGIRENARANKNFATADKVRDDLAAAQIVLEDRKGKTTWRRE
jgi:cysteinyl-tRNA synthetase